MRRELRQEISTVERPILAQHPPSWTVSDRFPFSPVQAVSGFCPGRPQSIATPPLLDSERKGNRGFRTDGVGKTSDRKVYVSRAVRHRGLTFFPAFMDLVNPAPHEASDTLRGCERSGLRLFQVVYRGIVRLFHPRPRFGGEGGGEGVKRVEVKIRQNTHEDECVDTTFPTPPSPFPSSSRGIGDTNGTCSSELRRRFEVLEDLPTLEQFNSFLQLGVLIQRCIAPRLNVRRGRSLLRPSLILGLPMRRTGLFSWR